MRRKFWLGYIISLGIFALVTVIWLAIAHAQDNGQPLQERKWVLVSTDSAGTNWYADTYTPMYDGDIVKFWTFTEPKDSPKQFIRVQIDCKHFRHRVGSDDATATDWESIRPNSTAIALYRVFCPMLLRHRLKGK